MWQKLAQMLYTDVDMMRYKDYNYSDETVVPRRPKKNLPPLPEDKECSNSELKKTYVIVIKKRGKRRQINLPVLPENDEC